MVEIFTLVFGPAAMVLAALVHLKNHQLESTLNKLKKEASKSFVDIVVGQIDIPIEKEVDEAMINFKKTILLYGSAATVRSLNKWIQVANNDSSSSSQLIKSLEKVLRRLRRDVGLKNHFFGEYELIQLFLKDKIKDQLRNKK